MPRHYPLRIILSLIVVAMLVFDGINTFKVHGLPFFVSITDAHHATLKPIKGIALPSGIVPGDHMDPAQQPRRTRIAIMANIGSFLPQDHTYNFVITRGTGPVTVPVTTVALTQSPQERVINSIGLVFEVILAGLALLVLWRGRDRAALGMAIWTVSAHAAATINTLPLDGIAEAVLLSCTGLLYVLARIGFYVMADAVARPILGARTRAGFLTVFIVVLAIGAGLFGVGGPLLYIIWGWLGGNFFFSGMVWSAAYLIPIALLMVCYQHALPAQRLRLRWMLISGAVFLFGIFLSNTTVFGAAGYIGEVLGLSLGVGGFLYAVLRHRVVDVTVLVDSTLVYGAMTALVVGVVAAVNSLALRIALPAGASLILQVVVPLSLGIVLGRVRSALDRLVEQVFFRKKYLREQALRDFAERAGYFNKTSDLFNAAAREISSNARAPAVAIYSAEADSFRRLRQQGEAAYPEELGSDDDAAVALRARREAVDLERLASALGKDSCAFPLLVLGNLRGLLVVKNRPQEHFSSDEKKLLTQVAQSVGAAWRLLRARDNEALVNGMAHGNIPPENAFAEARRLALAWAGN